MVQTVNITISFYDLDGTYSKLQTTSLAVAQSFLILAPHIKEAVVMFEWNDGREYVVCADGVTGRDMLSGVRPIDKSLIIPTHTPFVLTIDKSF